jgi:hypothetical protein
MFGVLLSNAYLGSLALFLLLLACLVVMCFLVWNLASKLSKKSTNDWKIQSRIFEWKPLKLGAVAVTISLSFLAGYGYRDHQLASNTRTYFGVSVLSQQSDRRYQVKIPGYTRTYDWEFCDPLKMPSPLVDIKYEQHYGWFCSTTSGEQR